MDVEIGTTWARAGLVVISSIAMLAGIIAYIRIAGLRSFSKMSAFDVAVTLAIGSLLGAVALSSSSLLEGLVAVGSLLGIQALISWLRFYGFGRIVDNRPIVLMAGGRMFEENMKRERVAPNDLTAKLREANVSSPDDVVAVVLETTGDISVIHGHDRFDPAILAGVRDADLVEGQKR